MTAVKKNPKFVMMSHSSSLFRLLATVLLATAAAISDHDSLPNDRRTSGPDGFDPLQHLRDETEGKISYPPPQKHTTYQGEEQTYAGITDLATPSYTISI